MRFNIFITTISIFLFLACSESSETGEPMADQKATFMVDGMVCEMGCGGAIRKELYKTGAVTQVDVDFDEEQLENFVHIYFDSKKFSVDQIGKAIETINDNQFTVSFVKSKEVESSSSENTKGLSKKNAHKKEQPILEANESFLSFPNFAELLSGLIF